jgi:hypothetical protein
MKDHAENGSANPTKKAAKPIEASDKGFHSLIEQWSLAACERLGLDKNLWLTHHQQYHLAPIQTRLTYYSYIKQYGFNPLLQEIILVKHADHSWQVLITVDGWSSYMNHHPQFRGIAFEEAAEQINQVALWMQCSIYREDRSIPITVREYYQEVKNDHSSWEQKPRRMLRYRAISQCARLAFGIALPEAIKETTQPMDKVDVSQEMKIHNESHGSVQAKTKNSQVIKRVQELKQILDKAQ